MGELGKFVAGGIGGVVLWKSLNDGTKTKITETIDLIATKYNRNQREKAARKINTDCRIF